MRHDADVARSGREFLELVQRPPVVQAWKELAVRRRRDHKRRENQGESELSHAGPATIATLKVVTEACRRGLARHSIVVISPLS